MGRQLKYVIEGSDTFECRSCGSHLTTMRNLTSKNFYGRHGQTAYLFKEVINVRYGEDETQHL